MTKKIKFKKKKKELEKIIQKSSSTFHLSIFGKTNYSVGKF